MQILVQYSNIAGQLVDLGEFNIPASGTVFVIELDEAFEARYWRFVIRDIAGVTPSVDDNSQVGLNR